MTNAGQSKVTKKLSIVCFGTSRGYRHPTGSPPQKGRNKGRKTTQFHIITANQPFSGWNDVFPDPGMTVAAIDRLVHHSTIFEMNVESYRRRTASDKQTGRRRQSSSDNHPEGATNMAE